MELRAFSSDHCRALDFFVAEGGKAVSCANESHVRADTFEELVTRLEAVCFWNKTAGLLEADIDWEIRLATGADFAPTSMTSLEPIAGGWSRSFQTHLKDVEAAGLPIRPYLGRNVHEIGELIVTALGNAVSQSKHLNPKGKGWEIVLKTEYDFQNLFFVTVKPWLPGLGREEIAIHYDGQEKRADFNLFGNQVIVELKHVTDAGTKAAVVKTLTGLQGFYATHANVRLLLFGILVDKDVELDALKWESDYSFTERTPQVWTRIFRSA